MLVPALAATRSIERLTYPVSASSRNTISKIAVSKTLPRLRLPIALASLVSPPSITNSTNIRHVAYSMSIGYGWYLIVDGLESTANLGGRSTAAYGTRACTTSATVQRRRPEMIGTTNWRRRYLWRANPPTLSECHFRPPQRLRRLAESSHLTS